MAMKTTKKKRTRSTSEAEWVTKMSLLGKTDRDLYRQLRKVMWEFVVENSGRSDFPSDFS